MSSIVKYETDHGEVQLSQDIVRRYLVSGNGSVTHEEVVMFIKLCQFQKLNPFLREAYLIKFGNNPATMVTGKEVFTKRAFRHPKFDGFEAGITVEKEGKLERREGALLLDGESVIAGWARVYLKDTRVPLFAEASFAEYAGRKKDGTLNRTWTEKPATMIRKVAVVQALREAFPEDLGGLYDAAEMGAETDALPTEHIEAPTTTQQQASGRTEALTDSGDDSQDGSTEEVTEEEVEAWKTMRFPDGQGWKYPDYPIVEVVKTDPDYIESFIKRSKDESRVKACRYLLAAWREYKGSHTSEAAEDAGEAEVVM